jgi:hypothetical protein
VRKLLLVPLLAACGGGWTDGDTKSATDSVRVQARIEQLCSDAGKCDPPSVRALERSALCGTSSMLSRHGQVVPEAGVTCQAP